MLSILWLYEFPNWLFCATVIAVLVGFALSGQVIVRRFSPRWSGTYIHPSRDLQFDSFLTRVHTLRPVMSNQTCTAKRV